jgi:hypothetical protein
MICEFRIAIFDFEFSFSSFGCCNFRILIFDWSSYTVFPSGEKVQFMEQPVALANAVVPYPQGRHIPPGFELKVPTGQVTHAVPAALL